MLECFHCEVLNFWFFFFFYNVQQSISAEAISVWEHFMVKISHICNLSEKKICKKI